MLGPLDEIQINNMYAVRSNDSSNITIKGSQEVQSAERILCCFLYVRLYHMSLSVGTQRIPELQWMEERTRPRKISMTMLYGFSMILFALLFTCVETDFLCAYVHFR